MGQEIKHHAPPLHFFSSTKYILYEHAKNHALFALFLGLMLNLFVYLDKLK